MNYLMLTRKQDGVQFLVNMALVVEIFPLSNGEGSDLIYSALCHTQVFETVSDIKGLLGY